MCVWKKDVKTKKEEEEEKKRAVAINRLCTRQKETTTTTKYRFLLQERRIATTERIAERASCFTDLVGSSMHTTLHFRSSARAMASSCLSPTERAPEASLLRRLFLSAPFVEFSIALPPPPPLPTDWESKLNGKPTASSAAAHSASVLSLNGSKLSRMVPDSSTTSWGIMLMARLSLRSPIFAVSSRSTNTKPLSVQPTKRSKKQNT
jgi:hypothetical protein